MSSATKQAVSSAKKEAKEVKEAIDSKERLKTVVQKLYRCGSDNRQQKNGAHEKLYSTIAESTHSVNTCGIDALLPRHLQTFVDTKKFPDDCRGMSKLDGLKEIAEIIYKLYKENNNDVYIKITSVGLTYLLRIIDKEELKEDEYRKHFNIWGKYGVITYQEKSKNRPGKQKSK